MILLRIVGILCMLIALALFVILCIKGSFLSIVAFFAIVGVFWIGFCALLEGFFPSDGGW